VLQLVAGGLQASSRVAVGETDEHVSRVVSLPKTAEGTARFERRHRKRADS
jgi:hypothetical protein